MPISRRLISQLTLLLLVAPVFTACSTRPSNSLADEVNEIDWTQWGIDTQTDRSELIAGTTLTVECSVQAPVDVEEVSIPLKVVVTPEAASVERVANGVFVVGLETAVEHRIACAHASDFLQDMTPEDVLVLASDAVSFEVVPSDEVAIAGQEILVDCEGVDAFGNSALDPPDLRVDVDVSVQVSPHSASDYSLGGTLVGQYDVNCISD